MVLYNRRDGLENSGVAILAGSSITRFIEKPKEGRLMPPQWVNAGLIIMEPEVINYIPINRASDIGSNLIPNLLSFGLPVRAYLMTQDESLQWIDTPEDYQVLKESLEINKKTRRRTWKQL